MVENYSRLADIYNHVMRRVRYDRWSEYLYYVTRQYVPKHPKVLELAAGNCNLLNLFSKYYPNIIATDLSLNMLLKGSCKNPKVCCNMLELPFKTKFDFIYSTFDSLNYITSKVNLLKIFREINRIISDEGIFSFDVSMEKNSIKHAEEPVREGKVNGLTYLHKSEYNRGTKIHKNIFEITDKKGDKSIEIHRQKIYPFETYFEIIPLSGLYVVECFKAFSFVRANRESERLQFILKKAGNHALL
jgi:SAM-dependent methyltransferase